MSALPPVLLAQEDGQEPGTTRRIDVPAPLGGLTPQLTHAPQGESGTVLTGSLGASALYDDHGGDPEYRYSIVPGIGLQRLGRETQWMLNYSGSVALDQTSSQNNEIMQSATADFSHAFSRRLAAEVREDYLVTNSLLARTGTSVSLPSPNGPGDLSSLAVPTTGTQIASVFLASLSYQLGRHSGIGINGNFSIRNFRDVTTSSGGNGSLIDTRTTTARAFFVGLMSRRQTVGAEYQLEDLTFESGLARTVDHVVFLFDEVSLGRDMKLSFFAGPEYSHVHNTLILNPDLSTSVVPGVSHPWSVAGGMMYTWHGKHSGFRASVRRDVSDGGGFLGPVRLNTGELELQSRLAARWKLILLTSYSDGRSLQSSTNGEADRITTAKGMAGVERQFSRSISVRLQYAHVYQPHGGTAAKDLLGNHNQAEIAFTYHFHKTLAQ